MTIFESLGCDDLLNSIWRSLRLNLCPVVTLEDSELAISPIISKVFEHSVLDRFLTCLNSCDAQFGFKKGLGCRNAIYVVRTIVDKIIAGGNTVSVLLI